MELSQTSLAMLLLTGLPVGAVLHWAYALTDMGDMPDTFAKKLIRNLKDFVFAIAAGLAAIFTVYFVNNGEFRYMVLVGIIGGFGVSHLAFQRLIVGIRDAILRLLTVPLTWIWANTMGRLLAKVREKAQDKKTQLRTEQLMLLALNGFEN